MRLLWWCVFMVLACLVLGGCAGGKQALAENAVMASWAGAAETDLLASWGTPSYSDYERVGTRGRMSKVHGYTKVVSQTIASKDGKTTFTLPADGVRTYRFFISDTGMIIGYGIKVSR